MSKSHWGLFSGIDIGTDGDPYLDRLRIFETPWVSLYLHHIHREDRERDPHDHPWAWFWSLVLCGAYSEAYYPDKADHLRCRTRTHLRFSLHRVGREAAHLISAVHGPLWTLVLTGPDKGTWGFYRQGQYVNWRDYVGPAAADSFEARKAAGRSKAPR